MIKIWVEVSDRFGRHVIAKEISDLRTHAFEPVRTTDDVFMAIANGEKIADTEPVRMVIKTRKDAAEVLAKELAEMIVEHMEKNDTHNGYLKNKSES